MVPSIKDKQNQKLRRRTKQTPKDGCIMYMFTHRVDSVNAISNNIICSLPELLMTGVFQNIPISIAVVIINSSEIKTSITMNMPNG